MATIENLKTLKVGDYLETPDFAYHEVLEVEKRGAWLTFLFYLGHIPKGRGFFSFLPHPDKEKYSEWVIIRAGSPAAERIKEAIEEAKKESEEKKIAGKKFKKRLKPLSH